jgi:uncharacterized membrane protein YccC
MKTSASLVAIRGEIPWKTALLHSARTAVAAIASLLIARCCRLPETYWAPMTTLLVTQSSLRETASKSGERFIGTALGAIAGVIVSMPSQSQRTITGHDVEGGPLARSPGSQS